MIQIQFSTIKIYISYHNHVTHIKERTNYYTIIIHNHFMIYFNCLKFGFVSLLCKNNKLQ